MQFEKIKDYAMHKLRTSILGAAIAMALTGLAGGCRLLVAAQAQPQQKTDTNVVSIDNFSFTPMELTISAGTPVTWTNKDDVPHTVVSVDHKFKSQVLDTDEKFSFTFATPGAYEYFCSVHPKMVGKIVVK
jgi:plastocyanin